MMVTKCHKGWQMWRTSGYDGDEGRAVDWRLTTTCEWATGVGSCGEAVQRAADGIQCSACTRGWSLYRSVCLVLQCSTQDAANQEI